MSVPGSKREESKFQVVETATRIYNRILDICLRMPNRYTYLILQPILNLAGEVADNAKKGNTIMPDPKKPNQDDVRLRRLYFQKAKASLQALITRMNFFVDRPQVLRHKIGDREVGVTEKELNILADEMRSEFSLLQGVIDSDQKRYRI